MRLHYARLPQYLNEFSIKNCFSSVALQSDQYDQFYRLFVGFPIAHAHGKLTLPILMIDCFHYQCPSYDGVAIALTSKTGFGLTVVYAFGIIPTEDTNNISWFLQLCALHGIDFDCALFTDQGPLLLAANAITQNFENVKFNLMLCLQHMIRNIIHRYPAFKQQGLKSVLSSTIDKASSARNMDIFFFHIDTMVAQFVDSSHVSIETVSDMTFYILRIDPCHWTVFANTPSFDKKTYDTLRRKLLSRVRSAYLLSKDFCPDHNSFEKMFDLIKNCNKDGVLAAESAQIKHIHHNNRPCARFYHQRTNIAESLANLFLSNGF
jgi:hypothetical protein